MTTSKKGAGLTPFLFVREVLERDVEALRADADDTAQLRLSVHAKALLWALAMHADAEGRCFVGTTRLRGETSISRTQLRRARRELETDGLLRVERAGGGSNATRFRLLYDAIEGRHSGTGSTQVPVEGGKVATTGSSQAPTGSTQAQGGSSQAPRGVLTGTQNSSVSSFKNSSLTAPDGPPPGQRGTATDASSCPFDLCDGDHFIETDDRRVDRCRCHPLNRSTERAAA